MFTAKFKINYFSLNCPRCSILIHSRVLLWFWPFRSDQELQFSLLTHDSLLNSNPTTLLASLVTQWLWKDEITERQSNWWNENNLSPNLDKTQMVVDGVLAPLLRNIICACRWWKTSTLTSKMFTKSWADGTPSKAKRVTVCQTHSLRLQPDEEMTSLRYTAPSSSIRLDDRSMTSRVAFCLSTLARWCAPSRVTWLLQTMKQN